MTMGDQQPLSLVGDIGGTHARFALVSPGSVQLQSMQAFRCAEFTGPGPAIAEYLRGAGPVTVSEACLAVAAPVTGKVITMTNNRWRFDTGQLAQHFGLQRFRLVNDYTAMALGVLHVPDSHLVPVGGGEPTHSRPILVLGPGTGLGISALVPAGEGWRSEEHTSELQSRPHLVCRLLLEKKNEIKQAVAARHHPPLGLRVAVRVHVRTALLDRGGADLRHVWQPRSDGLRRRGLRQQRLSA